MAHSGVYVRYGKNGKEGHGDDEKRDAVMTVKEVCKKLKCGKTHIYNMINSGKLSVFKVGEKKGIRVYVRDVERIMEEQTAEF